MRELRLEVGTNCLNVAEITLLSTIKSEHIRKITFTKSTATAHNHYSDYWTLLDSALCGLCPPTGAVLHMEIQTIYRVAPDQCKLYLQGFQKVGMVTFVGGDGVVVTLGKVQSSHDQHQYQTEERK